MPLEIRDLELNGPRLLVPPKFDDGRGFFSETYNRRSLAEVGIELEFVQDNHSLSLDAGTVRGLHFQTPPHAQAKLVRVARGAVLDVVLDLRIGSPHFGHHASVVLSAENWHQIFVPVGFAHGFCTLTPNTEVLYKVDQFYAPAEGGIAWNDPDLGIAWPPFAGTLLSDKDKRLPRLRDFQSPFQFNAQGS